MHLIVLYFQDVSVDAVEDVILNISVTGFPAPCITWFRDGQPLEEDEVGIINDSLERQSAIYTCVATNKVGEATTTARLTVLPSSPQTKSKCFFTFTHRQTKTRRLIYALD